MYCPTFATPASPEQKFCRACGVNLQIHAGMLAGQASAVDPETARLQRQLMGAVGWAGVFIGYLIILLWVGDATIEIRRDIPLMRQLYDFVQTAWAALLTVGFGFLAYFGLRLMWSHACGTAAHRQSSQPTPLPPAAPTMKLPSDQPEFVPSVTEHTTEILDSPRADEERIES